MLKTNWVRSREVMQMLLDTRAIQLDDEIEFTLADGKSTGRGLVIRLDWDDDVHHCPLRVLSDGNERWVHYTVVTGWRRPCSK